MVVALAGIAKVFLERVNVLIENRGCWCYFPKFYLYEIHKMVKTEEGLESLFMEKRLDLINNFDEIINILKDIQLRECEFRNLKPIEILD